MLGIEMRRNGKMKRPGNLYLVLHGYLVVHEHRDRLEVVLPEIPGHVFRAGSWLNEAPIAKGSELRLLGVQPGNTSLVQQPLTVFLEGCSLTPDGRAATIWLPLPTQVLQLLVAARDPASPAALAGIPVVRRKDYQTTAYTSGWKQLSTLQVLVYPYNDLNQVALEKHYWEPCGTNGAVSLHIISESAQPEGAFHELQTELAVAKVIRNFPGLEFPDPRPIAPSWFAPGPPFVSPAAVVPPGGFMETGESLFTGAGQFAFAQAEMEEIEPRSVRVGCLGRIKQQGRPLENLWQDRDLLDGTTADCPTLCC
jgi:hypothetical protein